MGCAIWCASNIAAKTSIVQPRRGRRWPSVASRLLNRQAACQPATGGAEVIRAGLAPAHELWKSQFPVIASQGMFTTNCQHGPSHIFGTAAVEGASFSAADYATTRAANCGQRQAFVGEHAFAEQGQPQFGVGADRYAEAPPANLLPVSPEACQLGPVGRGSCPAHRFSAATRSSAHHPGRTAADDFLMAACAHFSPAAGRRIAAWMQYRARCQSAVRRSVPAVDAIDHAIRAEHADVDVPQSCQRWADFSRAGLRCYDAGTTIDLNMHAQQCSDQIPQSRAARAHHHNRCHLRAPALPVVDHSACGRRGRNGLTSTR